MNLDKLFFGIPPSGCRKFLLDYLEKNTDKYDVFINPCAGRFVSCQIMVRSGIPKEKIFNYDISLFSSVLGYYLSGKDINSLNVNIDLPFIKGNKLKVEEILYCIKYQQIVASNYYMKEIKDSVRMNMDYHVKVIKKYIVELKKELSGIHYEIKDLHDVIPKYKSESKAFVYFDPPIYSGDYDKLEKKATENITWSKPSIEMFKPKKANVFFETIRNHKSMIWMYFNIKGNMKIPDFWEKNLLNVLNLDRKIYLLSNHKISKHEAENLTERFEKGKYSLYDDKEIDKYTKIGWAVLDQNQATYYRNLLVHKLGGTTSGDLNIGLFLDRKLFYVCGINVRHCLKWVTPYVYKIYGLTINNDKYRLGRLATRILLTNKFKKFLNSEVNFGPSEDFIGICTTTYSKYSTSRMDKKFSKRIEAKRDKITGIWAIKYLGLFSNKTLKEIKTEFLDEEKRLVRLINEKVKIEKEI